MTAGKRRAVGAMLAGVVITALLAIGALHWWNDAHFAPSRDAFPMQGALIDGRIDSRGVLKLVEHGEEGGDAPTADFLYAIASIGASQSNEHFLDQRDRAARSGVQMGAVHRYDPCVVADRQSANFVTVVPRDADLLPPAVMLTGSGEDCHPRVRPAEVESELIAFLNQIEMHAGRRALLMPTPAFETEYGFGAKSNRPLWLIGEGEGEVPPEGSPRWAVWTANTARSVPGLDAPVGWIVLNPSEKRAAK